MGITIFDVIEPGRAEEIQSKVQYATLVKCFQSLEETKVELISKNGEAFVDLLLSACSRDSSFFNWKKMSPTDLRGKLFDAIGQKIAVGLIAMGKITMKKISSEIFHIGRQFISDDIIRQVCCGSRKRFEVKQSKGEMVVQLALSPAKAKPRKCSEETERMRAHLKQLYHSHPEVIDALHTSVTYKHLLTAYSYWHKYCGSSGGIEFLDWVRQMARACFRSETASYETRLHTVLANIIKKFLETCGRTIPQITEHLCIDRPGFISQGKVVQIVAKDAEMKEAQMMISKSTKHLPVRNQLVELTTRGKSSLLPTDFDLPESFSSRIWPILTTRVNWHALSSIYKIVIKTNRMQTLVKKYGCFCNYLVKLVKFAKPKLDPIDFKIQLHSVIKTRVLKVIDKHSCLGKPIPVLMEEASLIGIVDLDFVHEMAESYSHEFTFVGPDKLAFSQNFTDGTNNEQPETCREESRPPSRGYQEDYNRPRNYGDGHNSLPENCREEDNLSSRNYPDHPTRSSEVRLYDYGHQSSSYQEGCKQPSENSKENYRPPSRGYQEQYQLSSEDGEKDGRSPLKAADPLADLESPRVLHLLTKQPRYVDIFDVFITIPEAASAVLANNSMSFFEWLINLSKRLMPHDTPIFEAHLQNVIQEEVVRLHSVQRCQMTIHHVHSRLCMQYAMLLSPNFLSWCLEQPKSPFTVHHSWIYLKNSPPREPPCESELPETSTHSKDIGEDASLKMLLDVVSSCSRLADVIKAIKSVPLEHVGYIIQNNSYWFDYIENNIRDRQKRLKLYRLLTEEARSCLGPRILKLHELASHLSKGVANFLSDESLEYVLQQRKDIFALSGDKLADCHVSVVRQMEGDGVVCCDENEENLMRQVLLYFPTSGSCEVSTLLGIICKEDSFMYKDDSSPSPDYMKCFFKMFPMLFYSRGDVIVLTCMALEKRGKYRSGLYPTSTTGNDVDNKSPGKSRKSRKRHSRSRHHRRDKGTKRRKRDRSCDSKLTSSGEDGELDTSNDVIVIEDEETSDKDCTSKEAGNLVVDEESESSELMSVIEDLPGCLLVDIATSLLLNNGGKAKAQTFLAEILRATVASDESQRIINSTKLFSAFRKKTFEELKNSLKFELIFSDSDEKHVHEIKIKEPGTSANSTEIATKVGDGDDSQVEEITSTSRTPEKKFPPHTIPSPIMEVQEDNTREETRSNSNDNDEVIKLSHTEQTDLDISPISRGSDRKISEDRSSVGSSESDKPKMPLYSSSASSNYASNRGRKNYSKTTREGQLLDFFQNYLEINAGTCQTDLLINSAHRRFATERFARSRLAFEAYSYDIIFSHHELFVLSGTGCEFGVTRVSRSGNSLLVAEPANLFFLQFVPHVCQACCIFLSTKPHTKSSLDDVCEAINTRFQNHLGIFSDGEVGAVVRCMVLVSLIRNLRLFCFAVNEPVVYLRDRDKVEVKNSTPPQQHEYRREVESILENSSVTDAVLLMADIIRTCKPTSQTSLRNLWQSRAPPTLAKVFGTGISFTLNIRKYSFVFPASDEGLISVDEDVIRHIVRPIE